MNHALGITNLVRLFVSGGEFNVAANLADCFGLRTGIATAHLPVLAEFAY